MTTEQSRREFEEVCKLHGIPVKTGNVKEGYYGVTSMYHQIWQASRASLLAEIQSPECVEEVAEEIAKTLFMTHGFASSQPMNEIAEAAISVIIKKLNGEK